MKTLQRYWHVWLITATNAVQETFINRWSSALFLTGKVIRLSIMLLFIFFLLQNVTEIGGYSSTQMLVFFLVYNLVDTGLQVIYRGVYEFGYTVRDGSFDSALVKPINPLFRILMGTPDLNDVIFLAPSVLISWYLLSKSGLEFSSLSVLLFFSLLINAFIIGTALHIFILSFTLLSSDVDNIIWLYRDISRLGQFPVTLYFGAIRLALFFIIPIGVMVTIPSQVLLQLRPSYSLLVSWLVGATLLFVSLRFWNFSVKKYSSAGG